LSFVPRRAFVVVLLFAAVLFRGAPLFSQAVPADFDQGDFDSIASVAGRSYLDPDRINPTMTYAAAAEAAVQSLPYPLLLWPRTYLEKRVELGEDADIPGRVLEVAPGAAYVIFQPDHVNWQLKQLERREAERARLERMSIAEKQEEARKLRDRRVTARRFVDQAWRDARFSRADYDRVVTWVRENRGRYLTPPPGAESAVRVAEGETPPEFDMNRVYFAAINGYLGALDPHSSVIARADWDRIVSEAADSTFEGIGALLRGGGQDPAVVETPLADSPALRAGLRSGDVIRKVDGRPIQNLLLEDVVRLIRGPRGTTVQLEVERLAEPGPITISIQRGVITQKAVTSDYVSDQKIGVLRISSFLYKDVTTEEAVRQEWQKLDEASGGKMRGLILDLRGNSGGDLEQAIRVSGLFLPPGAVVVQVKYADQRMQQFRSPIRTPLRDPRTNRMPIIVLVNALSASASEIFASAMMDHNAALVLGERTFGKATVQQMIPSGDNLIKLTVARYYAPRGYTCQIYGVRPDLELSDEPDRSFPLRFREEDMLSHLPELIDRQPDPARNAWLEKLKAAAGDGAAAEKYLEEHRSDARRPDYMLTRALPYFEALRQFPNP
jgi:C-terminal peptidase prc